MTKQDKVAILMAVYNGEEYLARQIDSILNQTFSDWELYLSDDLSTDRSLAVLSDYQKRFPDKIFVLENGLHYGNARDHFFHLLGQNSGRYVMFSDQDDVWLPDKICLALERMKATEEESGGNIPVLVHTDLKVTDSELHVTAESFLSLMNLDYRRNKLNNLLVQNIVTGCTVMINRPLIDRVGEPPRHALMHDGWLALIACCFGRIEFVTTPTILYRQHAANQVGAKNVGSLHYKLGQVKNWQRLKSNLNDTYAQADEFVRRYGQELNEEQKSLLLAYADIPRKGKFNRIKTLIEFDFLKIGASRAAAQIMMV